MATPAPPERPSWVCTPCPGVQAWRPGQMAWPTLAGGSGLSTPRHCPPVCLIQPWLSRSRLQGSRGQTFQETPPPHSGLLGKGSRAWESPNPTSGGPRGSPWQLRPRLKPHQLPPLGNLPRFQEMPELPQDSLSQPHQTCPPCTQAGESPGSHIAPRRAPAPPLNRPLSWPALPKLGRLECIWTSQNVFSFMRIMPGPLSWVQSFTNKALSPFSQVQGTERRGQC